MIKDSDELLETVKMHEESWSGGNEDTVIERGIKLERGQKRLPGRYHKYKACIIRVRVAYSSIKMKPGRGYDYLLEVFREKTPGKRKRLFK